MRLANIVNRGAPTLSAMARIVDPSVLAEYVRKVMVERQLDAPRVEFQAKRLGYEIDKSYVNKILSGAAGHLTVPKLQALAAGLGVSEEELFRVARGICEPDGFALSEMFLVYETYLCLEKPLHRQLVESYLHELLRMMATMPRKVGKGKDSAA